jgi:ATP-binding cassette subfamily B multidrug efflux pump
MIATPRMTKYLKPYWHWALLAPLMMMIEVAMDLMQPRLIERIVDEGIAQSRLDIVIGTGVWMVVFAFVGLVGGLGCTVFATLASQGFGADVRSVLFRKVQSLSFGNLDDLVTGELVTRLTNDVVQVQEVVLVMLRIMVRAPLMLVGSLILAILTSPQLAVLFFFLIPIVLVALGWIVRASYPMFRQVQEQLDGINTVMQENLAGVRVVKAFVRSKFELARFRETNDAFMVISTRAVQLVSVTMPFMTLVVNIGVVGALWIGGVQVSAGSMQAGQIIAFINYLMRTLMSLVMVSMLVMRVSRAAASAGRINEVLDSEPKIRNRADAVKEFQPRGRVAFEDVTFSYDGDGRDAVLKNVSVVAEPGQTVAILGTTGSGKTSLVSLIPRFYDVNRGRVTVDDIDVRAIDERALRAQIGIALQESVLFSGTIGDNIRYGRPSATDDEVIEAAKIAQAHAFISDFPDGYASVVGQRGVNLSGGQKQRIAIARALLTQPAVLILDDATSAVDVETEGRIQAELLHAGRGITSFIVAQRISTVLAADKIWVLDQGQVVAEGTHEELMKTSAIYREIYESQLDNGVVRHVSE